MERQRCPSGAGDVAAPLVRGIWQGEQRGNELRIAEPALLAPQSVLLGWGYAAAGFFAAFGCGFAAGFGTAFCAVFALSFVANSLLTVAEMAATSTFIPSAEASQTCSRKYCRHWLA
jgi:hypothetical protein